jgi:hypothetical protein
MPTLDMYRYVFGTQAAKHRCSFVAMGRALTNVQRKWLRCSHRHCTLKQLCKINYCLYCKQLLPQNNKVVLEICTTVICSFYPGSLWRFKNTSVKQSRRWVKYNLFISYVSKEANTNVLIHCCCSKCDEPLRIRPLCLHRIPTSFKKSKSCVCTFFVCAVYLGVITLIQSPSLPYPKGSNKTPRIISVSFLSLSWVNYWHTKL